jgi:hypothetical protein
MVSDDTPEPFNETVCLCACMKKLSGDGEFFLHAEVKKVMQTIATAHL